MIPCSTPLAQYLSHKPEIDLAVARVLDSGWYILGEETRAFEAEFAQYIKCRFATGVGSGTEAIHVALKACGIGAGDEVITVSHTAVATVAAIELTGAVPVLVDVDPVTCTLDPRALDEALSSRTRAVVAVHLYGQAADLEAISAFTRKHGLRLIEDCAQCHGAEFEGRKLGSFGDISCFSFYPTKNLGCLGDGGMVATNDADLASQLKLLREYGWAERYVSHIPGWNSRLDEIQAAVLRVKLRHLDESNQARGRLAEAYDSSFAELPLGLPARRAGASHVFHLYVVTSDQRDELQQWLKERGIGALIHYPVPIHLQPAYVDRLSRPGKLQVTEKLARTVLSLPMYPELPSADQDKVIEAVRDFFKAH
jgi:dTDP-4-amino-4,6-dideoxygalactose transaminase